MINYRVLSIAIVIIAALSIEACKTKKSTNTSTANNSSSTATTTNTTGPTSVGPLVVERSKEGINVPEEAEIVALQKEYPFETLTKLNEGYELYAKTTCLGCHNPKSIYKRDIASWKGIIDDMAARAKLTEQQKDAVYKYVLAIKATQPK